MHNVRVIGVLHVPPHMCRAGVAVPDVLHCQGALITYVGSYERVGRVIYDDNWSR